MTESTAVVPTTVFAKTTLGLEEIQRRGLNLPLLMRRLLVLVDGKRSLEELAAFVPGQDVQPLIQELLELNCVEAVAQAAPRAAAERASAAKAPAAAREPETLDDLPPAAARSAQDVEMARNFMANSIQRLMDPVMAAPFVQKAGACRNAAELRALFPEWEQVVGAGWGGPKRLKELRVRLFEVL